MNLPRVGQFAYVTQYSEWDLEPFWAVAVHRPEDPSDQRSIRVLCPYLLRIAESGLGSEDIYLDEYDSFEVHDACPDDIWARHVAYLLAGDNK